MNENMQIKKERAMNRSEIPATRTQIVKVYRHKDGSYSTRFSGKTASEVGYYFTRTHDGIKSRHYHAHSHSRQPSDRWLYNHFSKAS